MCWALVAKFRSRCWIVFPRLKLQSNEGKIVIDTSLPISAGNMASKRPPTAFFIFSEEQRESTRAECIAQAEAGAKISVAAVAKAIGEKWRAVTDDEKAAYKEKALERAKVQASTAAEEALEAGLFCALG